MKRTLATEAKVQSERELVGLALALSARELGSLSRAERSLCARAASVPAALVADARARIARGDDPLGEMFCKLRSRVERRADGATYTPPALVAALTAWGAARSPARVVDPGAGSARFLVAAGRALPNAELIAVERDPLAALLARAHLVAAGLAARARVVVADYRAIALPRAHGGTLFLGNPPYVRHHALAPAEKRWLTRNAARFGLGASQLSGLHVHFLLATALHARDADAGAFVTAAEWLDVNYGRFVRALLLGPLGLGALHCIDAAALPFADADTTAAIVCFEVGTKHARVRMRKVESAALLSPIERGRSVPRAQLQASERWSTLFGPRKNRSTDLIELGELCTVHRGQVTGANAIWIAAAHSAGLPDAFMFPCVTKARELFRAGGVLRDSRGLRRVIDLPSDLACLPARLRVRVERFLSHARRMGGDRGFIARHRRAWWSVGLREPAPILASYMARRPPAFVRNLAAARHINIAHGIYPREPISEACLRGLARFLSERVALADGRTYAGGLTKFEPKEMERLLVPKLELLPRYASS